MNLLALGGWIRNRKIAERVSTWVAGSPERVAFSIALGFVFGVFPLFGVPTVLCGMAAAVWGLNFPALQLVNYLVYPLQIALLWPFARLGSLLFGQVSFSHGWRNVAGLSAMALHTTAAWFCFAVPAGLILYLVLHRLLRSHRARMVCLGG